MASTIMAQVRALLSLLLLTLGASLASAASSSTQPSIVKPVKKLALVSGLVAVQWNFTVPEHVLQRAFLPQGSTARVKQVLLRLMAGERVRIGALGGSVTAFSGTGGGYFGLLADWLKKAFPKAEIIARNGAVGGSTPLFAEHQLSTLLDPGVDLVVLEYAVNSRFRADTIRYEDVTSYERLLRDLLTGQQLRFGKVSNPAVLIVSMWRCCRFDGEKYTYTDFQESPENYHTTLAQYYGVPMVSVRAGFYHAFRKGGGAFSNLFQEYPPDSAHGMLHPNAHGHKLLADLMVYAMYTVLNQLEQFGLTQADMTLASEPLPQPLVSRHYTIVLASWNAQAVQDVVVRTSSDWVMTSEKGKAGMQTTTPGDKMLIRVNTLVPPEAMERWKKTLGFDADPKLQMHVNLGLLKSYEHMGVVKVRCVKGCRCKDAMFDTSDPVDRHSVTHAYAVVVTQAEQCDIELRCEETTTSGEHKVSLRAMAVLASLPVSPGVKVAALDHPLPKGQ